MGTIPAATLLATAERTTDMTYEGWANYQTWNVALWINNDYPLYTAARDYAIANPKDATYSYFAAYVIDPMWGDITADGVSWTDPTLDHEALDHMLREMAE